MLWILTPPRVATTNASTAAEITLPKNARSLCWSAANVNSLVVGIRKTALTMAKVVIRLQVAVPRKKKKAPTSWDEDKCYTSTIDD